MNSTEKINIEGLDQVVSNIVRLPLHAPWRPDFSHRNCRLSLASDNHEPARIHVDVSQWTGVLCLSRDEDCVGGTELFRHKRTGLDRVPMDKESLEAAGFSTYQELQDQILDDDALDRSKWDLSVNVPMRFNRLILIQPHYWHTAGPGFGDSVENGRLVYLMFFNVRPSPGAPSQQS
ncbi:MAG TPA: DUF6445 family protein [Sphingomicrobium sp.]|nr:DUF6445 family protein [Sphingomicrobium sp.]